MNELMTIDSDKVNLIKRTVAKGATDDQLELFLHQARKTGLDPLARQINCIMRWNKRENRNDMAIQVSIDGYRLIADRTGKYAGSDDPVFDNGLSMYEHIADGANLKPITASVTVYKIVSGIRCPFTATASWAAYAPSGNKAFMWNKMPHLMLGKCAEALALRKAFPAELSGVYMDDEMDQAGPVVDVAESVDIEDLSGDYVDAEIVEEAQPEPASNIEYHVQHNTSGVLAMIADEHEHYKHVNHVKTTLKKLGHSSWTVGDDNAGARLTMYGELAQYAAYRDGGMDGEAALDAVKNDAHQDELFAEEAG